MKNIIYADNAATTPLSPVVLEAMMPWLTEGYGNASSIYSIAREAKKAIEGAREQVAALIGADKDEIYFTGSGSEADNWAIKGAAYALAKKGKHIISSNIEHHAVLHTLDFLKRQGYEITELLVDEYGLVNPDDLKAAIRPDTILVTIMMANNEVGTVEPIKELAAIAHEHGVLFHTDAVQAVAHIPVDVKDLGVDLLSLSGHKFCGPKGVGALYIKKGVRLENFMHGGGQEKGKRASTENTAGIVGLGKAAALAKEDMEKNAAYTKKLRDKLIQGLLEIPYTKLNGHPEKRLPGNCNISFSYVEGESILLMLDMNGICASSGSACTSGSLDPSHVLLALGLPHETAHGSVRLTLSERNTEAEVDTIIAKMKEIIERLRAMSPLYEQAMAQKGGK